MSKGTNENVSHILNMCPKLTTDINLKRHCNVAAILHRNICQHYGIKTTWKHPAEPVAENKEVKVLWHFEIRVDNVIPAHRPDIVVIDKTSVLLQ